MTPAQLEHAEKKSTKPVTSTTMEAVVFDNYGDPEVLSVRERPIPQRKSDELLIEVWASSVNPIDYRIRSGEMKWLLPGGFPRVPGYDVAGVVLKSPSDSSFAPGDRVMAFLDHRLGGALAEYATCSVDVAAKLPCDMPMEEAAAIPLAGFPSSAAVNPALTIAAQALRAADHIKETHLK